ncbi:MAG: hypothetical protein ACOX68_09235, partial [Candidatus Limivicinus sp.]
LYNAPAGLAFYWTLNNLFSLVKNIFIKLKNPKLVLGISSSVLGLAGLIFLLSVHPYENPVKQLFLILLFVLMQLPLILYFIRKNRRAAKTVEISKREKLDFFLGCTFLTLLLGLLIPSAVIKSSPSEFVDFTLANPIAYVLHNFLLCAGLFMLWLNVFYALANPAGKKVMGLALWLASGTALVNCMFFGTEYGTLSPQLRYITPPVYGRALVNLAAVAAVIAFMYLIRRYKSKFVRIGYSVLSIALAIMSVVNIFAISKGYREAVSVIDSSPKSGQPQILPLSREGKNVVVIMLDAAIGAYIPYIMNEKPELKEQFSGFTFYPNTTTVGCYTNAGAPGLLGGYDYTPENINARESESLVSKHNEALKVMPVLFDSNDFHVTVCDPPLAGYQLGSDLSIYDEYPGIEKFHTIGKYNEVPTDESLKIGRQIISKNFFCYSLFRSAPVLLQPIIYNNGGYMNIQPDDYSYYEEVEYQDYESPVKATGIRKTFLDSFKVLEQLPSLTRIDDGGENTFLMMANDTTHDSMMLQTPDYVPSVFTDNTEYEAENSGRFLVNGRRLKMENETQICCYHANMAAMLQLGKWMDYLKENGVYDNTRIIISADHGASRFQLDDMLWGNKPYVDIMTYNALLLVKDFNSTEFTVDNAFMTNADVPAIATDGIIDKPVNPFTGHPINSDAKADEIHVLHTITWNKYENDKTKLVEYRWFAVHDNIFDKDNWRDITDEKVS